MRRILGLGLVGLLGTACSGGIPDSRGGIGGQGGTRTGGSGGANGAVCTSQMFWMGGDNGSEIMHPGGTCLTCHSNSLDAPKFSLAGTVYPTLHEPDDCNGRNGSLGITVVVTDATGKQQPPILVNDVGNFHFEGMIASPFQVKVVFNGKESVMSASPANGECNSCHTRNGANSAAGRILGP